MAGSIIDRLNAAGLLTASYLEKLREEDEERKWRAEQVGESVRPDPIREGLPHLALLRLCDVGALIGGLTVDLDVRPDELLGPLQKTVGGDALKMRAADVQDGPPLRLTVHFIDHEETWELEDLYPFVMNVNDLLKDDRKAKAMAILGEWEDSLQLWAVEKTRLAWMLQQDWFHPRNRHQLEAMVG
ncbi:MAG: hypothetical protein ACJ790_12345 [Myxococcaceae bacterium]